VALIEEERIREVDSPAGLKSRFPQAGSLQEALELILNPETLDHVNDYFEEWDR
jgi:hypothetical protein